MVDNLKSILHGFLIGIANIIPGVSGGNPEGRIAKGPWLPELRFIAVTVSGEPPVLRMKNVFSMYCWLLRNI